MISNKKSTDILNLSQSLEDNQTKIEETHKLIQQIERQLQTLSQQPSLPLTIPTETYIQNQSQQQNDLIYLQPQNEQYDQNTINEMNSRQYYLNQRANQIPEQELLSSQNEYILQNGIDNQGSIQFESKQQSAHFQQLSHSGSLPAVQVMQQSQQNREIGKIKSQISPPSRGERNLQVSGQINQSLLKENAKDGQQNEIKEIQREHFQEITLLEQAYRKKLLDMEGVIEQQKLQFEKYILDMQHMAQVIEQKESLIGQFKNRQSDFQQRTVSHQEQQQEIMVYVRRLELCEKEKQELLNQNQDLSRQYKLVLSQNEILSTKYNRILGLYNQLVDSDKEKFIQSQYGEVLNKEQSIFFSPHLQSPFSQKQNQINISSIQPLHTPGPHQLQESRIQQQNELELLDEIYQQRSAAAFNSINKLQYPINYSNQNNTYGQQLKKQLFPIEQMYYNQPNYYPLNQLNNNNTAMVMQSQQQNNQSSNIYNQNQENQKLQNVNGKRKQSNDSLQSDDQDLLPSKGIENINQENIQTKKVLSPQRESQVNKSKSTISKTRKIGGDLKNNVANIKNLLDDNIKENPQQQHYLEIKQNTQASKLDTLQNILDISESVQNKKQTKSKSGITNKSSLSNKQNSQSKSNLKVKSTKKTQK